VAWFPVVGVGVGLTVGALYAGGCQLWSRPLAAALAVAGGMLLTGAFHEDGLADVADAFGGGHSRDDVVRILKDPRHGTFGVCTLVAVMAVRVAAISSLGPLDGVAALVAAHALGRGGAAGLMGLARPASGEGLGAGSIRGLTAGQSVAGVSVAMAAGAAGLAGWGVVAAALVALCTFTIHRSARRKLGGITGDVLGAVSLVGELASLLVAAAVVHRAWPALGWWPQRS
jgi:adenosylcobinamide-GDP ribazoletransferase